VGYTNTYFTWPLLGAGGGFPFEVKGDGRYDAAGRCQQCGRFAGGRER
jgi:hypothetical protein